MAGLAATNSKRRGKVPADDMLALGYLAGVLGFHLRQASAAVYRDFARQMASFDLTQKQFAVLELIASNAEVSQIDLATTLGTDRATMMALVDRLEVRSLLTRRASLADRRRQMLFLTDAGQSLLAGARIAVAAHEQRFTGRFSGPQLAGLIEGLERIYSGTSE